MSTTEYIRELGERYLMHTSRRNPIVLSQGKGARVWDMEGKEYLDFLAGYAVNVLGHCHPRVVQAIEQQVGTFMHVSNWFHNEPSVHLARLLVENGAGDRVFFSPSGAEAIEGAIKLARKYASGKGNVVKTRVITAIRGYHGRTYGALSASGKPDMREGFGPTLEGFTHVPFNDLEALEKAMDHQVCAVILEPIQGEAGAYVGSDAFLSGARELCDRYGALLVFDEIQTGMGRTGSFFAYQDVGIKPDILTVGKGISGGLPNAAIAAFGEVASAFQPGDHGATFGANPVVCAAGIATVQTILEENLLDHVKQVGDYLKSQLQALKKIHPIIEEVRGKGLLVGLQLSVSSIPIVAEANKRGLLVAPSLNQVVRILPPLIITKEDVDEAVSILDYSLRKTAVSV
jgi:acetylornithine/N-succinyldiaminopimelate aminotransferase